MGIPIGRSLEVGESLYLVGPGQKWDCRCFSPELALWKALRLKRVKTPKLFEPPALDSPPEV